VFFTLLRAKLLHPATMLCETQKCGLVEFNGEADHVHLLVDLAPDIAISKLVKPHPRWEQ